MFFIEYLNDNKMIFIYILIYLTRYQKGGTCFINVKTKRYVNKEIKKQEGYNKCFMLLPLS
jgi:hypothetical protein